MIVILWIIIFWRKRSRQKPYLSPANSWRYFGQGDLATEEVSRQVYAKRNGRTDTEIEAVWNLFFGFQGYTEGATPSCFCSGRLPRRISIARW